MDDSRRRSYELKYMEGLSTLLGTWCKGRVVSNVLRRSDGFDPRRVNGVDPRRVNGVDPRRVNGVDPRRVNGDDPTVTSLQESWNICSSEK
ncbi:hypothetical protein H6P81_016669 [Aristolochia fimbriata]|uniref:Uncharacterized protein n=1 Tax=Aristolochia fimbriata TaxID=158543 RepID=A0AAV7EAM6_ARIFI|nr:hypothetical protein H6P81_016669 [Aristolochia fimbriata]